MKVTYVNVWGGFSIDETVFTRIIRQINPLTEFEVGLNDKKYDLVISLMPNVINGRSRIDMEKISCKKLCFTGESYPLLEHTPNCDGYIGFDYEEDMPSSIKYLRIPLYTLYHIDHLRRYNCSSFEELKNKFYVKEPKRKFSAMVSNPSNQFRNSIISFLVKKGLCDSGGAVENTTGKIDWSFDSKMNLAANCMYSLAFENVSKKGYITEKIYEGFMVGSVPYYWGAPDIRSEFNPKSYFVFDASSHESMMSNAQKMIEVLHNDELFNEMRNEDPFTGYKSEIYLKSGWDMIKNFIQNLLETK